MSEELNEYPDIWAVVNDDNQVVSTADTLELAEERRRFKSIAETQLGPFKVVRYVPAQS